MTDSRDTLPIERAKGRPMLSWVGKRALGHVTPYPAQHVERFAPGNESWVDARAYSDGEWPETYPPGGLLFHGDNKEVLAHLLANGFRRRVKLVYIDPPFDSGADYVRKVQLRGVTGTAKIEAESYAIGEQIQYTDIWANDTYLQFMYERLLLLRECLREDGFLVLHLNAARVHYLKVVMDEVFGEANFRNEIVVKRIRKSYSEPAGVSSLNEGSDYLLLYSKSPDSRLTPPLKYAPKDERWHGFDAPNIRTNMSYELFGRFPPPGRHWMRIRDEAEAMIARGDLRANPQTGAPEYRLPATDYISRDSLWDDITASAFKTGYPTEKHEDMLQLVLEMCSSRGDLVLDCFLGSGTTAAVAQKMGRRWIGCDVNKGSIQTASKRLQTIICDQRAASRRARQTPLLDDETHDNGPVQTCFTTWRVNNYDLTLQHNEAVNLACEHIGIQRTRSDSFFDGTLGSRLAKIVPFGHPLSPLDLEEVKRELQARPTEDRTVVMVCLGKELAADRWLEDWNRLRTGDAAANRIEVIELRTDPKYGGFIAHEPAVAAVSVQENGSTLKVMIDDFISPTIVKRLDMDLPVFRAKISDWRSMVDVVLIDADYDGQVFNIALSDVPEKKSDLVQGCYELPAPKSRATIAVKIIDMLGEEVLVTHTIGPA